MLGGLLFTALVVCSAVLDDLDHAFLFAVGTAIAMPTHLATFAAAMQHPRLSSISPRSTKVFCASCCKDLLNALVSGPLGLFLLAAMLNSEHAHLRCEVLKPNLVWGLSVPPMAAVACGGAVGFFLADCAILLLAPREMTRELGGQSAYVLMWVHHLLAILVWPYALLASRSAVFAVYFLATEFTNVFQNLFWLASRGELFGRGATRAETLIGGLWLLSFFAVRVAPVPFLGAKYVDAHFRVPTTAPKIGLVSSENAYGCNLNPAEWAVSVVSIALPVALNLFWFLKMLAKAWRTLAGTSARDRNKR